MILSQVMAHSKKAMFLLPFSKSSIKIILGNFYILKIAITWPKIIQTSQVGGVLETSGPPLDDGHTDF